MVSLCRLVVDGEARKRKDVLVLEKLAKKTRLVS